MSPKELLPFGQSIWLDYIRRQLITGGELQRLVREDGLRGITSNPSIFEKAIAGSTDYDETIEKLARKPSTSVKEIYESLAVEDIRSAADVLRPVYDATDRADGYVCLEVSPYLLHDTNGTIAEARRLWKLVDRENAMIKVPGAPEGLPVIQTLLGEGININVTLLFSQEVYRQVTEAFLSGLETYAANGGDLKRMASVASFFVSRVDTLVNRKLDELARTASPAQRTQIDGIVGKVGIANSKLAYQDYKQIFGGKRFQALAAKGARPQRVLWASTSTKDPRFRDVLYVEELIGPNTVDTVPPATLDAFRDHGRPRASLEEDIEGARRTLETLGSLGISLKSITDELLVEGGKLFSEAFDKLLGAVEKKRTHVLGPALNRIQFKLPEQLDRQVKETVEDWRNHAKVRRLWARDATLWTSQDEAKWLDWLCVAEHELAGVPTLTTFAEELKKDGIDHVAVLGMGGSSLCPDVLSRTFQRQLGFPEMLVLDSTDPAQIRTFESKLDLANTLFIVSSKSGSTLEPNLFAAYFHGRVMEHLGDKASKRFVAITDPHSSLETFAKENGWSRVFYGVPGIGGRYSALSNFGLVPAAAMGLDVRELLERTNIMVHACDASVPLEANPGVLLGAILGTAAKQGRDKVTLVASPGIVLLGGWLEQLLAESTGKEGKGLIPVDREVVGLPEQYGNDRVFAYLRLDQGADPKQDAAIDALEKAGQPVVRLAIADPMDIGQEFFRWELATAVAGSIIGINAFNQPDVEASKVEARKLTDEFERTGQLKAETPFFKEGNLALYADERNHHELEKAVGKDKSVSGYLRSHLQRLQAGDYCGLLAWMERNDSPRKRLESMRHSIRDQRRVATCLGFGPRFLHSTGQAHKGGPNTGVFLHLTCDDPKDLPIPDRKATFSVVKRAQARGDFRVLANRNRRLLRVHLGADVDAGLDTLLKIVQDALR